MLFLARSLRDVGQRDGDDHPVQRLARPGPLQQIEECFPAGAVHRGVRILRGVAAGGVDQHRVVGEPPVAQPRAADARDRVLPHLLGQREMQPGVQQRSRLAGAGRADDDVPRLLIQPTALAAPLPSSYSARLSRPSSRPLPRPTQPRRDRCSTATLGSAPCRGRGSASPGTRSPPTQTTVRTAPMTARGVIRFQQRQERPENPDQCRENGGPDEAEQPAGEQDLAHSEVPLGLMMQDDFDAAIRGRALQAWHCSRSGPRPPALRRQSRFGRLSFSRLIALAAAALAAES